MDFTKSLFRKEFFIKAFQVISGLIILPRISPLSRLFAARNDALVVIRGADLSKGTIENMVKKGFEAMGGIDRFIKKGMKVVIKPNIGWNSPPERAHNTNPYIVETVARMCRERGARVQVFDRTCNKASLCYVNSGIRKAAKNAGAAIEYIDSRRYRKVPVKKGLKQKYLYVYEDMIKADFVINIPIAKHHSLAQLTLSMKNLMGVLGGNRGDYHHNMDENIVDFTKAIRTDLTIMDATRILTDHGPSGGTLDDVKVMKTIIFGKNPVTVDAYTTTLFGREPRSIGYIKLAGAEGMGEINVKKMRITHKTV